MIKIYHISKIDGRNPYYDDIAKILHDRARSSTRGSTERKVSYIDPKVLKEAGPGHLMLYVCDSHAVASLRYFTESDHIYVNLVHTLPEYRRRGFSIALFNRLFGMVRVVIRLEVDLDNHPAISLYKKLGFTTEEVVGNEYICMRICPER